MFIPVSKIQELIDIAHECDRKLPEEEKKIHVLDIAATLQKLIDDEVAELDKMAKEYESRRIDEQRLEDMAREYEEEEWGRLQMEEAAIEKELEIDFDWPGGL